MFLYILIGVARGFVKGVLRLSGICLKGICRVQISLQICKLGLKEDCWWWKRVTSGLIFVTRGNLNLNLLVE